MSHSLAPPIIEHLLEQTSVTDLVGTKIEPKKVSQETPLPYLIVTAETEDEETGMQGGNGLVQTSLQIDCIAVTDVLALEIGLQVDNVIKAIQPYDVVKGTQISAVNPDGVVDAFDEPLEGEELGAHRRVLTYSIWWWRS